MKHAAVVALHDQGGQILVMRRGPSDTWRPGRWNLPGGHLDGRETARQAAIREVREETGVRLPPRRLRYLFSFSPERGRAVHVFSAFTPVRPVVRHPDGEHDAHLWAPAWAAPSPGIPHFQEVFHAVGRLLRRGGLLH